jgi:hypothetical protein
MQMRDFTENKDSKSRTVTTSYEAILDDSKSNVTAAVQLIL